MQRRHWVKSAAPLLLLVTTVVALYGPFIGNPFIFDDIGFFSIAHPHYLTHWPSFSLRWLPYASFEWTRSWAGGSVEWLRAGNLCVHALNGYLLHRLVLRLGEATGIGCNANAHRNAMSIHAMAWASALWFVVSPAAVFGAGYLVQRTILMATMFSLATALLFLRGMRLMDQRWMAASVLTYFLAALSKEHAIMVPTVILALVMLLRPPSWHLVRQLAIPFGGYTAVGIFVVYQVAAGHVIANAYEPNSVSLLDGIDSRHYYPLSVVNQGYLFFQYLWVWLVPDPTWMAIDVRADFPSHLWAWPQAFGFAAFVGYGVGATTLLLRRGGTGLLGFALLAPWLLFATELATVRVQETFVIYRSYLWMPWFAATLPLVLQRISRVLALSCVGIVLLILAAFSWQRLQTFSDPTALWDESLRRAQRSVNPSGLGRIYHNRGVAYLDVQRFDEAIRDFTQGIQLLPSYSALYNDRAVAYLQTQQYALALKDYDMAIRIDPNYYNPFLGRAKVHEALGNAAQARRDYALACRLGVDEVCTTR